MISTHRGRSYEPRSVTVDGKRRTDFVMRCATPGCVAEGAIHSDPNCPPSLVVQKFQRLGWLANERNAAGCFCPTCASPKPKRKPDVTVTKTEPPKGPTHEQLKQIRDELRECFDPDAGHYLDGGTDERLGIKLSVPWAWVKQARDLFDFVIKVDPEVKALQDELGALTAMLGALDGKIAALVKKRAA